MVTKRVFLIPTQLFGYMIKYQRAIYAVVTISLSIYLFGDILINSKPALILNQPQTLTLTPDRYPPAVLLPKLNPVFKVLTVPKIELPKHIYIPKPITIPRVELPKPINIPNHITMPRIEQLYPLHKNYPLPQSITIPKIDFPQPLPKIYLPSQIPSSQTSGFNYTTVK